MNKRKLHELASGLIIIGLLLLIGVCALVIGVITGVGIGTILNLMGLNLDASIFVAKIMASFTMALFLSKIFWRN